MLAGRPPEAGDVAVCLGCARASWEHGLGLHPPDDEPHRRGIGLLLKGQLTCKRTDSGFYTHVVRHRPVAIRDGRPSASGAILNEIAQLARWRMADWRSGSFVLRQTATTAWV